MTEPLRIAWASDYWDEGNAYGYSTHNRKMREHVAQIPGVVLDPDAEAVVTIQSANKFEPVPGRVNFLFTMFEATDLPWNYRERLHLADHIVVPCEQNRRMFERYTDLPVSVCTEGVDVETFTEKRRRASKPFRILWVGAPNPRKGYEDMIALAYFLRNVPDVEVYLKTTILGKKERRGNVILDGRNISIEELVELYHSAHLFVLPSRGEGFGLTLAEAMATGAPCIATKFGGPEDYFDSYVGYPVDFELREVELPSYELLTKMAFPDFMDLTRKTVHVLTHYKEAAQKGKLAARRIRHRQTWPQAAARLVEIVRDHMEGVGYGRNAA